MDWIGGKRKKKEMGIGGICDAYTAIKRSLIHSLPMMSLKTKRLRPRHPRRNPDLSHIVRFRRGRVSLDEVLELAGKDLAVGVTGDAGWLV